MWGQFEAIAHVIPSSPKVRRIHSDKNSLIACLLRSSDQWQRKLSVFVNVKLQPQDASRLPWGCHCRHDFLYGRSGPGTQHHPCSHCLACCRYTWFNSKKNWNLKSCAHTVTQNSVTQSINQSVNTPFPFNWDQKISACPLLILICLKNKELLFGPCFFLAVMRPQTCLQLNETCWYLPTTYLSVENKIKVIINYLTATGLFPYLLQQLLSI